MKPEYYSYIGSNKKRGKPISARIPKELEATIRIIADLEHDSINGLIIEGLARIVEDRKNDSDHMKELLDREESRIQVIRSDFKLD